jgi:SAM-dependent methyltransferase
MAANCYLETMSVPGRRISNFLNDWWKRERSASNRLRSLRLLSGIGWEFLRDFLPERKRRKYGDAEYDWEYRVDTTSATVSWRARLLGLFNSPYQPIDPNLFREMVSSLKIDFRRFTFVDIGSGKGRALLLACEYPFRRILGVEILPELNEIAIENIKRFADRRNGNLEMEAICADAATFEFPSDPLALLLFNPLPEASLRIVIHNLENSLREHSRPVYVLYANPVLAQVLEDASLLQRGAGNDRYYVFSTRVPAGSESPDA